MIKRLLGGMNFIEYSGDRPKMTLLRHDYKAPVCKVHVIMRDPFGNKMEDTTTLGKKRNPHNWEPALASRDLVEAFIMDTNWLREQTPLTLDNKTYSNFKIISVEIINEWTEPDHYFKEVVSPEQD